MYLVPVRLAESSAFYSERYFHGAIPTHDHTAVAWKRSAKQTHGRMIGERLPVLFFRGHPEEIESSLELSICRVLAELRSGPQATGLLMASGTNKIISQFPADRASAYK